MVFTFAFFKVMKLRHDGFSRVLLPKPYGDILKDAGVTPFSKLQCLENPSGLFNESSWVFASVTNKIYVARGMPNYQNKLTTFSLASSTTVLVFFQKGGGKNGRHGWILSTPNVHNLSNIGVQLFEYAYLRVFRAVHEADAHLRISRYELIPGRQLLTILQEIPSPSVGPDIEISEKDYAVYRLLQNKTSQIALALKYINRRKDKKHVDVDSEVVEQK